MKLVQVFSLLLLATLWGSGCTSRLLININSIADKNVANDGKSYVFVSDMPGVDENDLYFKEFSGIFDEVLRKNGYVKAKEAMQADFILKLKYAVSDGVTGVHSYRIPIYGPLLSESYTVTERTSNAKTGAVTGYRQKTVFIPASIQYLGSSLETYSYTLYNRVTGLTAVLRSKDTKNKKADKIIWQIQISNVSESNDLRQIMPYFAYAARNYLGKSTLQQLTVTIDLKDEGVAALRASQLGGR